MKKKVADELLQDDMSRKKARDDDGRSVNNGYYRNQNEVDAAFAKRIARERAKWEEEQAGGTPEETDPLESGGMPGDAEETDELLLDDETMAWIDEITEQADYISEYAQDFDLMDELDNNPLFGIMLAEGEDLEKVYGYFYPEYAEQRIIDDVEKHVVDKIRSRSALPSHISYSMGHTGMDVKKLSDAQIRDIDKRVRTGEKVRF